MEKHTVDTSQHTPPQGIPADQVKRHPSIMEMPPAPGNAKAGVPVSHNDATQKPIVAGTKRPTIPVVEDPRVPASSEYVPPPDKVTSSNTNQEPSR